MPLSLIFYLDSQLCSKLGNGAFEVVKDLAAEKAKKQRDDIIRFLGSDVVDGFKTRMCVNIDITQTEKEIFSVKYTPSQRSTDHIVSASQN